jgi:hypothetical protein
MIETVVVKYENAEVVSLAWVNEEMTVVSLNSDYNVIPGVNDFIVTYNPEPTVEPITGRLVATCLITNGDVTSIVLNSSGYEVIATNTDGVLRVRDLTDFFDKLTNYTRVEETWTRSH